MSHILLLEVPGGNDFTVLDDAVAMGHRSRSSPAIWRCINRKAR